MPTTDEILERTQWDFFWVPPDARVVDRPELAYVCAPRDLPLLNTVARVRAEPARLPALVAEVGAAHRGVTSRWNVPATIDRAPLERLLAAGGWAPVHAYYACTASVDRWAPRRPAADLVVRKVADVATLRDAIRVADAVFGGDWEPTPEQLARDLEACTRPGARVHRFVTYTAGGEAVATAGLSLFPALGFGFLFGGSTLPAYRGRGAYTALLAARVETARQLGFARVGLYARTDTSAPIVTRLGFERHGSMEQWDRPAAGG